MKLVIENNDNHIEFMQNKKNRITKQRPQEQWTTARIKTFLWNYVRSNSPNYV